MPIAKAGQFSVVVSLYPRMNANKTMGSCEEFHPWTI
jgi:hypothetical protein